VAGESRSVIVSAVAAEVVTPPPMRAIATATIARGHDDVEEERIAHPRNVGIGDNSDGILAAAESSARAVAIDDGAGEETGGRAVKPRAASAAESAVAGRHESDGDDEMHEIYVSTAIAGDDACRDAAAPYYLPNRSLPAGTTATVGGSGQFASGASVVAYTA